MVFYFHQDNYIRIYHSPFEDEYDDYYGNIIKLNDNCGCFHINEKDVNTDNYIDMDKDILDYDKIYKNLIKHNKPKFIFIMSPVKEDPAYKSMKPEPVYIDLDEYFDEYNNIINPQLLYCVVRN